MSDSHHIVRVSSLRLHERYTHLPYLDTLELPQVSHPLPVLLPIHHMQTVLPSQVRVLTVGHEHCFQG